MTTTTAIQGTRNDTTASSQWATRPDDQRFLTLEDLARSVNDRKQRSRQVGLALEHTRVRDEGERLLLTDGSNFDAPLTHYTFGQLCSRTHAPAGYLRGLPPALAAINLQWSIEHDTDDARALVRDGADGHVAAVTSDSYGRIWDADLVNAIRDRIGPEWQVPAASYATQDPKRATTLYASDRDVFIFMVDPTHPITVPGDPSPLFRGFYAWNSEVGNASLGFAAFLYRYVCLDAATEVLTRAGWKSIADVTVEDEVATLADGVHVEYHKPEAKQELPYSGPMIHWQGRSFDTMVTPDHMMYMKVGNRPGFERIRASEAMNFRYQEFKRDGVWVGEDQKVFILEPGDFKYQGCAVQKELPMDSWLSLLGWYLSEGHCEHSDLSGRTISITQEDATTAAEIEQHATACGFTAKTRLLKNGAHLVSVSGLSLHDYCVKFGKSYEKYVPDFVKGLSPRQIRIFLTALWRGDGSTGDDGLWSNYYTTSKRLADDVQELLLKVGLAGTVGYQEPRVRVPEGEDAGMVGGLASRFVSGKAYREQWIVSVSHCSLTPRVHLTPQMVQFTGTVYDITVKNHVFYIRRNGKAMWTGNCDNRIIWGQREYREMRIRHTSGAPHRMVQEVQPQLAGYLQAGTAVEVEAIQNAQAREIGKDRNSVAAWLKSRGFSQKLAGEAYDSAERQGMNPRSLWGAIQGITDIAQDRTHADARVDLERKAGSLMSLVAA